MGEALIYGAGWQLFGLAGYQELLREVVLGAFPWPETLSMARFTQEMDDLGLLAALICASRTRSFLCTGISRPLEVLQCVSTALLGYSNGQQWCLAKALSCILREVLLLEAGAGLQHHHVATVTLGQPPQRGLESRVTSGRALKAGGAQRFGATGAGRDLLELRPAEAALRWLPLAHEGLGGQGQGRGGGLRAIFAGSQGGG